MIKKLLIMFVAAAMLLLVPIGCQTAPASIDGEALYQKTAALGQFPDMVRRSPDLIYDYYGIDPAQCRQLVNYASSDGLLPEEFLFAETNDEAYAIELETLLKEQIAHQAEIYRDYLPQEYPKLANARIERTGCIVLVLVAEDPAPLYQVFTDALK